MSSNLFALCQSGTCEGDKAGFRTFGKIAFGKMVMMKIIKLSDWFDGMGNKADVILESCEDGFAMAREKDRPIIGHLPDGDRHEQPGVYKFFPSGKLKVVAQ